MITECMANGHIINHKIQNESKRLQNGLAGQIPKMPKKSCYYKMVTPKKITTECFSTGLGAHHSVEEMTTGMH